MQARTAKKMSQKDLGTKINEKPQVIQQYEGGKAVPNPQVISKIERALGVKLRGKASAKPAAAAPKHEEAKDTLIRRGARWREGAMLKAQKEASALKAQQMALAKQIQQATQAVVLNAGKRQQHQGQQQRQQKAEVDEVLRTAPGPKRKTPKGNVGTTKLWHR